MKKVLIVIITFFILFTHPVYAETCDLECNGEGATRTTCNVCKEEAAKAEIKRIENEIAAKSKNQDEAKALAIEYGGKIDALNADIEALIPEIDALQIRIDQLLADIETNTARVDEINKRVLNRMANAQATMHYNPMLDFLFVLQDYLIRLLMFVRVKDKWKIFIKKFAKELNGMSEVLFLL